MSDRGEGARNDAPYAQVGDTVRGQAADERQVHGLLATAHAVAQVPGPAPDAPGIRHSPPPGNPLPGRSAATPAERSCRRRLGPGLDREDAARRGGDADLGHRVYREVDRGPV